MKNLSILMLTFFISFSAFSQEEVVKDGWNFGALPSITFDTDLGFQYGALVNLYDYGDGSKYPKYNHSLYFEVSRFTKGSGINRFNYDSEELIKGIQTSVDISYLSDMAYDFYGFNGYEAVVNPEWIDQEDPEYISRMYYKYDRKLFRLKVDLRGDFSGERFGWATGINLLNFKLGSVDLDRLNKGKEGDDILPDVDGLYEHYQEWGIISEEEANGGFVPIVKAGLVYDTRDNKPNPMKGIWTDAVLVGSPEFLGGESSFAKIKLTHRQYFTIIPDDLSLVYRLAYQTTIAGDVPYYYQSQVITPIMRGANSEGLGGAKSLRGIRRNRVVGDGFFYGNIEARWKFARFQLINNNFYLGLNAFADFGRVTQKIDIDPEVNVPDINPNPLDRYFDFGAEAMHYSFGAGLRVAMNQNFVIAADYGVAIDDRDGDSGIYIGLNYLF